MVAKGEPEIIKCELALLATGQSFVVRAMASGHDVAERVDEYLNR